MLLPRGFTLKPGPTWNIVKASASYALSHMLKRPIVWGRPMSLMMEPISRCNLQCPLCPIGARELTRKLGTMTLETFKRALDNAGPQVRVLALWNQGEPTINDDLPEMVKYAHERGIFTMTSTNGMLMLRRNLIDRLIQAGLDEIIFSIDGLTPESYKIYRIGGHLDVVVEGIQMLRKRRDELDSKTPRIVMQWLPMKHNQHEIPYLRAKAKEWGADTVEIKTAQVYTQQQYDDYLPDMEALRRYEKQGQKWETKRTYQSCKRLWFSAMIDWNGNVVPCCFDKDEEFLMGNAVKEEFDKIWHSTKYNSFRRQLITKGRVAEMCRNCTEGLRSYYIPLDKLEKFAEAEIPPVPEENKPKQADYSDLFDLPVKDEK